MAFNINAHVILQGPKNISAVTKSIRSQLQNINVNVGVNVPRTAQAQITTLNKQLSNLNSTNQKLTSSSKAASSSVQNVGTSAKGAANAMQILGKETALTFKRFAAAGLVTATFFRLTQAISEAVPKALEFERGLNKLQQITGSTRRGLDGLAKTVDNLARSFGKDANEILEIAQIFAQTGQSIRQVEASVRAVARSSLAPTFGEMKQTAEGLVAALNQFGISARDSEKILGSLNRVSKKFAVESDDLIAAIRRAGGVFAISAGQFKEPIDALNEFTAIFTAVRSTTRETAETVATGLRTIFSRLQRRGTIDVLKGLGIELTDTNGKFKGLFESFRILSVELDKIVQKGDAITLSAITEELGGIRQIGKLIPAIRNFNKAERAFAEAAKGASEGLGKDVALGLEPLIVQFEKVQQRFSSVIRTISETSTFQALARTAVGLANAFLGVAESLSPVLPILAKLAAFKLTKGAFSFFQGFFGSAGAAGGSGAVGSNLGRVATGQRAGVGGGSSSSSLSSAIKAMNSAVIGLSKVTSSNTAATNSLNTTIKALQVSVGGLNSTIRARGFGGGLGGGRPRGGARGPRGFASGGLVPGSGNRDTVPAMLTPGEFVIKKSSVNSMGVGNLSNINKYAEGGIVGQITRPFNMSVLQGLVGSKSFLGRGASVRSIANEGGSARAELEKAFKRDITARDVNIDDEIAELRALRVATSPTGGTNPLKGSTNSKLRTRLADKLKGRGNVTRLKKFKTTDDVIKFAQGSDLEAFGIESLMQGTQLDAPNAMATGVKESFRNKFGQILTERVPKLLSQGLGEMGKTVASLPQPLTKLLDRGALGSIEGQLFEGFTRLATQNFISDDVRDKVSPLFDVLGGQLGRYRELFGALFDFPSEIKNNFDEDKIASTFGKATKAFGSSAIRFNPLQVEKFQKFASGGMASGSDTVPAMLTPGEYVINRGSARSIGYGNLNKMNKGGAIPKGVKGYAKGGIVQHLAGGGPVQGGFGGAATLAFILPDLLFSIPLLTESFKQAAEGVEGAGTQLISALASVGISAALLVPVLRQAGGIKGILGGGAAGRNKGIGRFFQPTKAIENIAGGQIGIRRGVAARQGVTKRLGRGASLKFVSRAFQGLLGPVALFSGALLAAGAIQKARAKREADSLRRNSLGKLDSSVKVANEALAELAESSSTTASEILKANLANKQAFSDLTASIAANRKAREIEEGTAFSSIGSFFSGFGSLFNDLFQIVTGETGKSRTSRKRGQSLAREGQLVTPTLAKFTKELSENSQKAFENVQKNLAISIVSGAGTIDAGVKEIDKVLSSLDTSTVRSTQESFFNLRDSLKEVGEQGKQAADSLENNLTNQFLAGLNEAVNELGPLGDQLAGAVSEVFGDNPQDILNDSNRLNQALFDMNGIFNELDQETRRVVAGSFNDLIQSTISQGVETAKLALEQEKYNQILIESRRNIDAVVTKFNGLTNALSSFADDVERIGDNLNRAVDELISGDADFTLAETFNPFSNLDMLGDPNNTAEFPNFETVVNNGINVIVNALSSANEKLNGAFASTALEILGAGENFPSEGILPALKVAGEFDEFVTGVIAAADALSENLGGAAPTTGDIRSIIEGQLGADFAGSTIGKSFIEQFMADLSGGRQGTDIGVDALREAVNNGTATFEDSGAILKDLVDSLEEAYEQARRIEQLTVDRLVQERKISVAIRDIDFRRLDLRQRVGEITGDRKGTVAEAEADLRTRVTSLTGGATDPAAILKTLRDDRRELAALEAKRGERPLTEDEAQRFVELKSSVQDNTQALKTLSEDTTRLAAVQSRIAELEARQDASRSGLAGLLGRLGQVQQRARSGDIAGARSEAISIRQTFATIAKLQRGIPLDFTEASKVLGGEFDQLLLDLGASPDQIKNAIDAGFRQAPGFARAGLSQIGVGLPRDAFRNANLGGEIDQEKDRARDIAAQQDAAFVALQDNLNSGREFIVAATKAITGTGKGIKTAEDRFITASKRVKDLGDVVVETTDSFTGLINNLNAQFEAALPSTLVGRPNVGGQGTRFEGKPLPFSPSPADVATRGKFSVLSPREETRIRKEEAARLEKRGVAPEDREKKIDDFVKAVEKAREDLITKDFSEFLPDGKSFSDLTNEEKRTTISLIRETAAAVATIREFARSQGVATTRVDRVTGPRGGTITTRSEVPVKDIVESLIAKLVKEGKTQDEALEVIAKATGTTAAILRQEQGLNSFSTAVATLRELANSMGVATTQDIRPARDPEGPPVPVLRDQPISDKKIIESLIAKLVGEGRKRDEALEIIAKATGTTAAILRQEQGLNSFSVFDNQANKKLDEQNKLTEKETSKADKRFPPRRSAFDTNNAGTASGSVKSAAKAANELSISRGEVASLMNKLEKAAVEEAGINAGIRARQERADSVMNIGGGASSAGPALTTTMQDALRRIRQENRDPAGVDPLAGKTAEQLQKMSAAMFEARRELIAFQKGLTDASKVTDQEVRDSIMRDLSPEERVQKVTNEMLEANMVREGQFGGMQRQGGMQAMIDKMKTDPSIGLQSDEEKLAAETAFRDKASRAGIVSGRTGAQSRAAITNRQLEGVAARLDPTATGDLQKDAGFTTEELVGSPEARRIANEQRPFDTIAAERRERMAAEQAREERFRTNRNLGVERGEQGLFEFMPGLATAVQEGRTSFGRFGTQEQEFSGLKGDSTSRVTNLREQEAFLKDRFTQEAFGRGDVDFDLLTADVLGVDRSLDPKARKFAVERANEKERVKRLNKITAAPGTAEFDAQFEDIAGGGFFGTEFLTKSERAAREDRIRSSFNRRPEIEARSADAAARFEDARNARGASNVEKLRERGFTDEEISKNIAEAKRKQFAGAKAAAIARKRGAKAEAAAPDKPKLTPAAGGGGPTGVKYLDDLFAIAGRSSGQKPKGLVAGVPGSRGNFREFGTGVSGRGSVDPQNFISGAAKRSMMKGRSYVTEAGTMGNYIRPRDKMNNRANSLAKTGNPTGDFDKLPAAARKAILRGTSKLVKYKPGGDQPSNAAGPEMTRDPILTKRDIEAGTNRAIHKRPNTLPIYNYDKNREGFDLPPLTRADSRNLTRDQFGPSTIPRAPMGERSYGGATPFTRGPSTSADLLPDGRGAAPRRGILDGPPQIDFGFPGAGAGIMGPDAVNAVSSLAGALNTLGGVIELKITEPIEVRLDQGNLMGEIKKAVAEVVSNQASTALAGSDNRTQMTPSTPPPQTS
jgi:TP901 family phage tail tape measure protein